MGVYLRAKFEVSSIIVTGFRQGVILAPPPHTSKRTPKKSIQIRVKVWAFFGKNIEKKHLHHHDKNDYYFWKSNIFVINLIVDSRNFIKVSKDLSL